MAPAAKESEAKDEVKGTKSEKRKKSEGSSKAEKMEQPREKLIKKKRGRIEMRGNALKFMECSGVNVPPA